MASGVTVLPSSSAGGKSSDGSRQKRKIAPGPPNGRKKVCGPKDTVKAEAARSAGSSKPSVTKRKDRVEDENTGDSSLEWDAARALTEMQTQVIIEERPPSPQKKVVVIRKESVSSMPQWGSRKKRRSSFRAKGSSDDSHTNSEPQAEQQSEGGSSIGKDSHSAFNPVKVEAPCGSVEQGCASDTEKQNNKVLSDSSCDFQQLDSRAESPTSPLPASVRIEEVPGFTGFLKLEDGARSSAFQKVIRPLRKPTVARKPKVEEKSYEAATPELASVKLVTRKKPKPTGVGQLPVVKTEEADAGWPVSSPAIVPFEGSRSFEDSKCANPRVAAAEEVVVSEPVFVKIETKPSVKPGQRAGGKLKPAISESEKEARRQRRVQANRESARQTIRRKQVLCEELSQKSQHLTVDNERLRNELDLKLRELSREKELAAHLKEKLAKCDESAAGSDFATTPSENGSGFKYSLPPVSYGQVPMPVHQMRQLYWYAYAAQASGMQPASEMPLALFGDYATALASFAMGIPPGYWMGLSQGGSQGGQTSVLPHFFAHPSVVPGSSKFTPPCGEEASSPPTSSTIAVSLPASQGEGSFSIVACGRERGLASAKSIGAYRASAFSDSSYSHDAKRISVKCESACEASTFASKAQYFKLTTPTQSGLPTSCIGGVLSRSKSSGEELLCVPPAAAHLARASSGNLASHVSKIGNPRYMFTNGGRRYPDMMGQELPTMMATPKPSMQNVKAAEARRRRKDLQRNRALHHRQVARVAEPPVS